jgi:hypothetical protein
MSVVVYIAIAIALIVCSLVATCIKLNNRQRKRDLEFGVSTQSVHPPTALQIENAATLQRLRDAENSGALGGMAPGYVAVPQRVERLRQPPRGHIDTRAVGVPGAGLIELAGRRDAVEMEGTRRPAEMDTREPPPAYDGTREARPPQL